jgi:tetratricopeptide (TPR) repeat protein
MKSCPTCKRTYADDSLRFCLEDGSILSASFDPQATQRLPGRQSNKTELIDALKSSRKPPDTIPTPVHATMPSPPLSAPGPQRESRAGGGSSRRWLLISLTIFVVLLIPVLAVGIWLLTTMIKGDRAEKRWLTMLARGQINATTVVKETTAELAKDPRNALALRARSSAYYIVNEPDQGKRDAEEVERLLVSAGSAEEYEARCYARWRLGKPETAVSDCTRAIELDPKFVWPYHNRGNAYNDKRDYVKALVDWNKAIELDPKFTPSYNNRGNYYTNTRDYVRAIADLSKAIEIDPRYGVAYNSRGNVYAYKGDYDRAIADYNKAIELDARDAWAYNYRGEAYLYKGNSDRAIADYNKAIEINPRFPAAYNNRGSFYYNKNQKDRALADFNQAIGLDPQWALAYQNRAIIYYDRKDYDRAIADYDKAIELNPQLAWSYNGRGLSYYYKSNYEQAIADYNKAIEIDPQQAAPFYNNRGVVYYSRKDYERAAADYSKAIELNPKYALAYSNRANAREALGDKTSATADRLKADELKKGS